MHRILELGPSAIAHLGLATHCEKIGDTQAALHHYREALAANGEMAHAYWMQGNLQGKLGQQAQALQSYLDALRLAQGFLVPVCRMSFLRELASQGDLEVAIGTLDELIRTRPDSREELREAMGSYFSGDDLAALLETLEE